jgi:hypothetical protein
MVTHSSDLFDRMQIICHDADICSMLKRLIIVLSALFPLAAIAQQEDNIDIGHDTRGNIIPCGNHKRHIYREFKLNSTELYSIEIFEDSVSVLRTLRNKQWHVLDTIDRKTKIYADAACDIQYPQYQLTDMNHDGYKDLFVIIKSDDYNNSIGKICMYHTANKSLQSFKSAEDDGYWASPEFHENDSTIECTLLSGVYGVRYTSLYKLQGSHAIPVSKDEEDTLGEAEGKHAIERIYKGSAEGKWKLVKKKRG